MIEKADLSRYAGQFVWLELNFDKAVNRPFFTKYGAISTPTFYVIDPVSGHVTASRMGAMSLAEFTQFLDRGAAGVSAKAQTPADTALASGDALLAHEPEKAADAYRHALDLAPANWSRRELAQASLTEALQAAHQYQACSETAATGAASMKRDSMFGRTVMAGMWCLVLPDSPQPWSKHAAARLEPLAKEALSLSSTVPDHRDELYRTLMLLCLSRDDKTCAAGLGQQWLKELDARKPTNDEERSAVDIARVENVQIVGDPQQILPALIASEQAMPASWNASLRVAQMESASEHYDEAISACDRGIARKAGPAGRSWLLRIKADALQNKGQDEAARLALEQALKSAQAIPNPQTRDNNVRTIRATLVQSGAGAKN